MNPQLMEMKLGENYYRFDPAKPIDISVPLFFDGEQPNAYGVDRAAYEAFETENLIGDTHRGGSCNFGQIKLIPHCNGTHTECVGHITKERLSVRECLVDAFIPAIVITVEPESARDIGETYLSKTDPSDLLITKNGLVTALEGFEAADFSGLIIRTLPNDDSKLRRSYDQMIPPYFSNEAMQYVTVLGVRHLLVDLPSIDRIYDEGRLSNHRIFWNVEPGSFDIGEETRIKDTVTELIYVSDSVADGPYLLNLQIAPFESDASPSRPILFSLMAKAV